MVSSSRMYSQSLVTSMQLHLKYNIFYLKEIFLPSRLCQILDLTEFNVEKKNKRLCNSQHFHLVVVQLSAKAIYHAVVASLKTKRFLIEPSKANKSYMIQSVTVTCNSQKMFQGDLSGL